MKRRFDTARIARALENAGLQPNEARAAALRLRAGFNGEAPPANGFETPSRKRRDELVEALAGASRQLEHAEENIVERIQAADRKQTDAVRRHLDAVEYRTGQHLDRHEKRIARLARRLFAAHAAILAIAVAALEYLR